MSETEDKKLNEAITLIEAFFKKKSETPPPNPNLITGSGTEITNSNECDSLLKFLIKGTTVDSNINKKLQNIFNILHNVPTPTV